MRLLGRIGRKKDVEKGPKSMENEVMQSSSLRLDMYPRTGCTETDSRLSSTYGTPSWSGVSPSGTQTEKPIGLVTLNSCPARDTGWHAVGGFRAKLMSSMFPTMAPHGESY